jgi:diadenosine tetraphosphatase ApaH/serine/threonine PP2A family protein phosphatase
VLGIEDFNPEAAEAARWTANALDEESRSFLASLPSSAAPEHAQLFHASARDPVWEYVLTDEAATATLLLTIAPVVLVGHSHIALAVTLGDGVVEGGLAPGGTTKELGGRWLLNPGSVGQPRDGDPNAAWLLLDFEARFASFRRVAYPIQETQRELRDAGLPEALASRLAVGQ